MADTHVASINHPHDFLNAVQRLQELLGVTSDGIIGPATRRAAETHGAAERRHQEVMAAISDLKTTIAGHAKLEDVNRGLVELGSRIDAIGKADKKLMES